MGNPACGNTGQVTPLPADPISSLPDNIGCLSHSLEVTHEPKLSAAQKITQFVVRFYADKIHTFAGFKDQVTAECRYCGLLLSIVILFYSS